MASNSNNNSLTATAWDAWERNWRERFSGKNKFSWMKWRWITHPRQPSDAGRQCPDQDHQDLESNKDNHSPSAEPANGGRGYVREWDGTYRYLNQYREEFHDFEDVAVYLSATRSKPRRLVVQATPGVLKHSRDLGDWKRAELAGSPPLVLRMSEWALSPFADSEKASWIKYSMCVGRLLLVAIPMQLVLLIPGMRTWEGANAAESYPEFPGYTWEWPRFAVDKLDRRPLGDKENTPPRAFDHRYRRRAPERLWVKKGGIWELTDTRDQPLPSYLFCSHTWGDAKSGTPEDKAARERNLRIARMVAEKEGFEAFWIDQDCFTHEKGQRLSYDIYTICDLVRGSAQVVVIPSEDSKEGRCVWGRRMWTFMEGLLAPRDTILFCHDDGTADRLHKVEVAERYWPEDEKEDPIEGGSPVRLLAEHLTGLVTLTNLEFLPVAIAAVASKERRGQFSQSDVAYATMGLLRYRIMQDNGRTFFQSLAQLSLENDSDNILERMICILTRSADTDLGLAASPSPADSPTHVSSAGEYHATNAFLALQHADQFGTRMHDIKPLCEVVGVVDEDDTVMLDNCRAMHIRWKNFPPPAVERDCGFLRQQVATFLATASYWWVTRSVLLAVMSSYIIEATGGSATKRDKFSRDLICSFLGIGLVFAMLAPLSVRILYSGAITKTSPCLVGFEGVMPIAEVEKTFFGNTRGRLSYAPSATPLLEKWRDPNERLALEPNWVTKPDVEGPEIPRGHHLFTLVDVGELTVSIFTAERPPTTALICGREGGMLRAVLCSWRFRNDCLYKETVVRMPSNVFDEAKPKSWIKVCLKSQDQARRDIAQASKVGDASK